MATSFKQSECIFLNSSLSNLSFVIFLEVGGTCSKGASDIL